MSAENGGPAFPVPGYNNPQGMTLRDYFAAHCPDSEVDCPTWGEIKKFKGLVGSLAIESWRPEWTAEFKAAKRYAYADAMLAARNGGAK